MVLAYVTSLLLLALSPFFSRFSLKFVYPDVKTYVKRRKWMLFTIFGLATYIPAALIALTEVAVPVYSPVGSGALLESGGNAAFMVVLFLGVLVINSSIVDFMVLRRRKMTVVGIPTHVIQYGIKKEIAGAKKIKRAQDIKRITGDLEDVLKEHKGVKPLLKKIRASVARERGMEGEELKKFVERGIPEEVEGIEREGRKAKERMAERRAAIEKLKKKVREEREEREEERRKERLEEKEKEEKKPPEEGPELPEEAAKRVVEGLKERENLVKELEKKLKKAAQGAKKEEKTQRLLDELKEKIKEDKEEVSGEAEYAEDEIVEITKALREMKEEEEEEEEEKKGRGRKARKEKPEEKIGESLISYEKEYRPRRGRGKEDVLKAVVGDVRQQMAEPEEEEEEEEEKARWYEKGPKAETKKPPAEPQVELFEEGLTFGEGLGGEAELGEFGELGDLGDLGDLSGLESMGDDLGAGEFDGMFVDVGETSGGCPNCGKKGTSVVYCPSCGKPLCSNCAASVEGSEDSIRYKCPHCKSEFSMKRRAPA